MTIEHVTGSSPETVVMVSLGPTKRDLLDMTTAHEPPPELMNADEVWGINGGANIFCGRVAWDVLWVMDYLEGEARREPAYVEHLMRWLDRHQGSHIMTSVAGRFARGGLHEYPLQAIVEETCQWGAGGYQHAYFHNSIPYVLAYAMAIGVKRLYLFGADYAHEELKGRERDRSNAEYWVALARERGMQVILPTTTSLCNANQPAWFYGYPEVPILQRPRVNEPIEKLKRYEKHNQKYLESENVAARIQAYRQIVQPENQEVMP